MHQNSTSTYVCARPVQYGTPHYIRLHTVDYIYSTHTHMYVHTRTKSWMYTPNRQFPTPFPAVGLGRQGSRALMCLLCRKSGRPNGTWVSDAMLGLSPVGLKTNHRKAAENQGHGEEFNFFL